MGTSDGFTRGDPLADLRFVELEPGLLERLGHPQRPLLPVGEELRQPLGEPGPGVVDVVAEDVQFARGGGLVVHRGDLDRGNDPHTDPLTRRQGLGDPGDGVVVGQREQLHPGLGRAGDDLPGREGPVGVGGVRLEVETGRHRRRSLSDALSDRRTHATRRASRGR